MKVFALFVLVLTGLVPTRADTTQVHTWDITATTCFVCESDSYGLPPNPQPVNLYAVFTVTPVLATGQFWDEGIADFYPYQLVDEVTGITGTLNGQPVTLGAPAVGAGSWLALNGDIGTVWYDVNGVPGVPAGVIYTDSVYDEVSGIPVFWSATDPVGLPEPATLLLLTVPLSLGLMRWAQMSLRKYSAR